MNGMEVKKKLEAAGFNAQELQRHLRHSSLLITEHYIRRNIGERNVRIRKKFPNMI